MPMAARETRVLVNTIRPVCALSGWYLKARPPLYTSLLLPVVPVCFRMPPMYTPPALSHQNAVLCAVFPSNRSVGRELGAANPRP